MYIFSDHKLKFLWNLNYSSLKFSNKLTGSTWQHENMKSSNLQEEQRDWMKTELSLIVLEMHVHAFTYKY